jgi:nitric oxide reductase NorD protein
MSTRPVESDLAQFYALFPQPELAKDLFNLVEGYRIDTRVRSSYPGIRRDMDNIQSLTSGRRPELGALPDTQAIVEALLQHMLGLTPELDLVASHTQSVIGDAIALVDTFPALTAEVADTARFTAQLYELIDDAMADPARWIPEDTAEDADPATPPVPEQQDAPSPSNEDYQPLELPPFMIPVMEELVRPPEPAPAQRLAEQSPEFENTSDSDAESDQLTQEPDGLAQATEPQSGADGHDSDEVAQKSEGADSEAEPGGSADSRSDDQEGGSDSMLRPGSLEVPLAPDEQVEEDLGEQLFSYDEWDYRIEDYRPAWCTLREQRATRTQEGFVAATFYEFGGIVSQIRRNFQLMRPDRLRKMRYQESGDDLDTDGLVEYVVEKRARISPSGRVYIKRDKKDRDVATAFLVDMSSSTDRKIDGRKRIIDIEKEALLLMCEALEAIRDEYAIYGFSGSGREDCQFYVVKELGDKYDDRVKARIGGIYARQKTRMGPAIRHAARRLAAADATVKLMILLTDGKPYDSDTYQDNTYAQEDTKIALREARREKIHLFCVTVDQEGADYLPQMYSDANFVIIDDVRTLPQKLPQLYRRLTS